MSERMSVTQALDERDLLVKKITDKIAKASFVDTVKPNEEKVYATAARIDEILSICIKDQKLDIEKPYVMIVGKGEKVRTLYFRL